MMKMAHWCGKQGEPWLFCTFLLIVPISEGRVICAYFYFTLYAIDDKQN
jgi:hypothetical protein